MPSPSTGMYELSSTGRNVATKNCKHGILVTVIGPGRVGTAAVGQDTDDV